MPFLNEQILIVNNYLAGSVLTDKRFKSGRFEGIARDVVRQSEGAASQTFPAVMDDNYEAQPISVDDIYAIIIYHKVSGKTYAIDKKQFGDKYIYMVETSAVKMVVYAKYAAIKMTAEQLEALITSNFPDNVAPSALTGLSLDKMLITLKNSNLNRTAVFGEEYKGVQPFLAPEDIFFSINYTIDTKYRKACISVCDCGIPVPALLSDDDFEPLVDDSRTGLIVY